MSVPPPVAPRTRLLRDRGEGRVARVTNTELFFDLVYVFAFIELSQHLYTDLTWTGAAETTLMFIAIWWSWNYTAWATGWLDPEQGLVVVMLAVLMAASLVTSSAIPEAFGHRGEVFAVTYVTMQLVRGGFMVWVLGVRDTMGRNYAQLLAWSAISGLIWIVGGLLHHHDARLLVWTLAAAIDLTAPLHGFRLPRAGATPMSNWSVAGGHLAERCQLLLMVAFGESFLRIGESFSESHGTVRTDASFIVGFVLVFALWALYFLHHAALGAQTIEEAEQEDAARLGRSAYAYAQAAMVGSVILIAVAIHMTIEGPAHHVDAPFAAICIGGPVLYLVGLAMSQLWLGHGSALRPLIAAVAVVAAGVATGFGARLTELVAVAVVSAAIALEAQLRS